ncbi:MAG: hypothetical protein HDQ96_02460 [Lachnospiraceae bacterium]|nr:hypothetical protein [Lachnospiraceae bacterium]
MDKIKILAMYLPQFHRVKENDEWWGEGFTDWVASKTAVPLFEGHAQPKTPLHENYYNLLEKSTMQQQSKLMQEYKVDGMCFYHYYFKDGRKILEKPAENLLNWKDIDMPYCFCWANESWARTWSNIRNKNSWMAKFEKRDSSRANEKDILLEQKYGREDDWREHFEYLLPFFRDERYIKIDGAPVFLIYKPDEIYCLYQMLDYWRKLADEYNFPGMYFIGVNIAAPRKGLDAIMFNAPTMYVNYGRKKIVPDDMKGVKVYSYDDVWHNILTAESVKGCKTFFGGLANVDGTPRHGKNGFVLGGFSIEKFQNYFYQLVKKNILADNEFVFINAWNEWGEGAYLEPDEEYGYQYLEAVRDARDKVEREVQNGDIDIEKCGKSENEDAAEMLNVKNKHMLIANCLDSWMSLKEKGINPANYLKRFHYNVIAIYGVGILGKHLLYELEQAEIKIAYIIDRRADLHYPQAEVRNVNDELDIVDAVVVTALADFDDIYETLKEKLGCPIFSITELISEV